MRTCTCQTRRETYAETHVPTERNDGSRGQALVDHGIVSERKCFVVYRRDYSIEKRCDDRMLSHFVNVWLRYRTGSIVSFFFWFCHFLRATAEIAVPHTRGTFPSQLGPERRSTCGKYSPGSSVELSIIDVSDPISSALLKRRKVKPNVEIPRVITRGPPQYLSSWIFPWKICCDEDADETKICRKEEIFLPPTDGMADDRCKNSPRSTG